MLTSLHQQVWTACIGHCIGKYTQRGQRSPAGRHGNGCPWYNVFRSYIKTLMLDGQENYALIYTINDFRVWVKCRCSLWKTDSKADIYVDHLSIHLFVYLIYSCVSIPPRYGKTSICPQMMEWNIFSSWRNSERKTIYSNSGCQWD